MTSGLLRRLNGEEKEIKTGRGQVHPPRHLLENGSQSQPPMVGPLGYLLAVEQPRPACIPHKPRRPVRWSTVDVCSRGHAQEDPGGVALTRSAAADHTWSTIPMPPVAHRVGVRKTHSLYIFGS